MASNKAFRAGPIALTATTTTNLLNPGTTTGGVNSTGSPYGNTYLIIRHIRVVNKTGAPVTVSLWLGATGGNVAGTELAWQGTPVPANGALDYYGMLRLDPADFVVGGAGSGSALSITFEGEIGIA